MNKSGPCRPGEIGHAETQRIDGQERTFSPSVRDRLVRLAYRFVWNLEDAEDVAHEALSKAFEQQNDLRQSDKWWSWTCRIVVRACHEHGRRKARRAQHESSVGYETAHRECDQVGSDESEQKEYLRRCVQELPRRQREVIVLRHLEDHSFEQIGEILGISSSTARVHARAGRQALRDKMTNSHEM